MAHLTITTTAFLCGAIGAPAPYRRPRRLAAAVLASVSTGHWTAMLKWSPPFRRWGNPPSVGCLTSLGAGQPGRPIGADLLALGDARSTSPSVGPLIVSATFALVEALPGEPLTGELPEFQVRRMMIAEPPTLWRPGTTATPRRRRFALPRNCNSSSPPSNRCPGRVRLEVGCPLNPLQLATFKAPYRVVQAGHHAGLLVIGVVDCASSRCLGLLGDQGDGDSRTPWQQDGRVLARSRPSVLIEHLERVAVHPLRMPHRGLVGARLRSAAGLRAAVSGWSSGKSADR